MTVETDTRLSSVLEKGQIFVDFRADDIQDAVLRLLVPLFLSIGFSPEAAKEALDCVIARERAGSTTSGAVALPHGRLPGLPRIVAAMGLNASGVFADAPSSPKLVLAFVTPGENPADHLRFLSASARILKDVSAVQEMLQADDPYAVLGVIRRLENAGK